MVNIKQSETTNMLSFLVMVPPYLLVIVKLHEMNIPAVLSNEYIYYYNILYRSSQMFKWHNTTAVFLGPVLNVLDFLLFLIQPHTMKR